MKLGEEEKITLTDIKQQFGIDLPEIESEDEGESGGEYIPDVASEHPGDSQPVARKPHLKFVLVLVAASAVVGFLGLLLMSGGNQQAEIPDPQPTPALVDDKEQEIAKLKAQISMEGQKQALAGNPSPTPTPSESSTPAPRTSPAQTGDEIQPPNQTPSAKSLPSQSSRRSAAPPPVRYTTPVPFSAVPVRYSAPSDNRRSYPVTSPRANYNNSPFTALPSIASQNRRRQSRAIASESFHPSAKQQQEIAALKQQLQELQAENQKLKNQPAKSESQSNLSPAPPPSRDSQPTIPTIEPVEPTPPQANVEQVSPASPVVPLPLLAIGSRVKGQLMNALQIAQEANSQTTHQVYITTTESLTTTQGWQVPPGAIVAVKVSIAPNGLVTGESQGIWYGNHPVKLPAGALSLSSVNDDPLIAQAINPNSRAIARAENEAMLWGAVGQVGRVLSQPDTSVSINNGGVTTTSTSNKPNVVGAILDGAFNNKASSRKEEAQKRRELALSTPPIWVLPAGTEVLLVANPPSSSEIENQVGESTVTVSNSSESPVPRSSGTTISNDSAIDQRDPLSSALKPLPNQAIESEPIERPELYQHLANADVVPSTPETRNSEMLDCSDTWGNRSYPHICSDNYEENDSAYFLHE
jgi:hypothetical protein